MEKINDCLAILVIDFGVLMISNKIKMNILLVTSGSIFFMILWAPENISTIYTIVY